MKCQVHESRFISINEDGGKSTRAGVSEVDQINRGQSRSNQAFGSQPNACACESGIRGIQVAEAKLFPSLLNKFRHKNVIALSSSGA
jgi:hypothetical protein